jgi:hypothetical protein
MSELKSEERTWEGQEGEAAIAGLREGIERLRAHVHVFRQVTAPKVEHEGPDPT